MNKTRCIIFNETFISSAITVNQFNRLLKSLAEHISMLHQTNFTWTYIHCQCQYVNQVFSCKLSNLKSCPLILIDIFTESVPKFKNHHRTYSGFLVSVPQSQINHWNCLHQNLSSNQYSSIKTKFLSAGSSQHASKVNFPKTTLTVCHFDKNACLAFACHTAATKWSEART